MKNLVVSMLMVTLVILGTPINAETPPKPNMFDTSEQCNAALATGNFSFYQPKYFSLKEKTLGTNGKTRVLVPLERNACVHMVTTGGRKWVPQKDGTMFRAHKDDDGSLAFYAREDCGNPVFGVSYPKSATPQVQVRERVVVKKVYIPVAPPPEPQREVRLDLVDNETKPHSSHVGWYIAGGVVLAGGIVYFATRSHDKGGKGPGGEIGPAFAKAGFSWK